MPFTTSEQVILNMKSKSMTIREDLRNNKSGFSKITSVIAVCAVIFWGVAVAAQSAGPDPLFATDTLLDITLTAPFAEIDLNRDREKQYPGTLSYVDDSGQQVVLDVNLEVRGNWRLRKDNCRYSQLWVDLKRGQTDDTLFAEQNRLKLVVQCGSQNRYRTYLAKEQQLYQVFAALTDINFGTRLLNTTYIYSDDPGKERTHLAFFIEHQRRLKSHFDMDDVELNSIEQGDLDPVQSALVGLFMYLIGNTDYSMTAAAEGEECCHNAKLLVDASGRYFPIPYDFDASGFVDTNYAPIPNPIYKLDSNRQRLYRGYCVPDNGLETAVAQFNTARERINVIVSDTTYVSSGIAKRSQRYVDQFYAVLHDEDSLQQNIVDKCRS